MISDDLLFTGPDGALTTKADDLAAYREGNVSVVPVSIDNQAPRDSGG